MLDSNEEEVKEVEDEATEVVEEGVIEEVEAEEDVVDMMTLQSQEMVQDHV